jgi:hypothetical protein
MPAYLYALWSGDQDALRSALLYGAVLGGILVGAGIVWEAKKLDVATAIVVVGVVLEAVCTIWLFVTDESISRAQQSRIEQLLAHRTLSPEQRKRIAALAQFPAGSFITVMADAESWDFVMEIGTTLQALGWTWKPCAGGGLGPMQPLDTRPASCLSILDHIEIDVTPESEMFGKALADAIREPSIIGIDDVRVAVRPAANKTIIVYVGTKR